MIGFYDIKDLIIFADNIVKIVFLMRKCAVCAVLEALFVISEIASAFISQRIQRAIAEKAIEILRILHLMAGKELTFLVLKEFVIF